MTTTRIDRDPDGSWTLYVNGLPAIPRESFAVVDNVRHFLDHPEEDDQSECAEVAASIRRLT